MATISLSKNDITDIWENIKLFALGDQKQINNIFETGFTAHFCVIFSKQQRSVEQQ
jgi:hypothetical protein